MKYGLIGKKLGHSFSAELHRRIGGYDYELVELQEKDLDVFFAKRDFSAVNVTIPYKEAVLPYLDEIDPTAASIGTVNTVVNRQGKLVGYNTDFGGMMALIRRMKLDLYGKKVLILGTGGTAKTAYAVVRQLGAAEELFVSRSGRSHALTYSEALIRHSDADVIINTTPVGMFPDLDSCPISLSTFTHLRGVLDVIYNPLQTRLILEARQRGIPSQSGLYMLVAQAALASELFTGNSVPAETVENVYTDILREKRNLVLIGMPGSGKTTVGKIAASKLGRKIVDLDEMIQNIAGKPIREIFAQDGEAAFRELEAQAVREIAGLTGLVIATGGGCVLRPENVDRLRRNGLLFLLDRAVDQLLPTGDRPLADTARKLKQLYSQRMPLYRAAADQIIAVNGNETETSDTVIRRFIEET